jgi:hypothetical protein
MKTEQKKWRFTRQTTDKYRAVKCSLLTCEDFLERLRSETMKKATQRLRTMCQYGEDVTDQMQSLPQIYPSAEFKKAADGKVEMTHFNGIVALELSGQKHDDALSAAKYATSLLPFTLASFVGTQGNNVIVLVRVSCSDGSLPASDADATHFCEEAYSHAVAIYSVALGHTVRPINSSDTENPLHCHFPLSFDESPYYNPEALPLKIGDKSKLDTIFPVVETISESDNKGLSLTERMIRELNHRYAFRYDQVRGVNEYREYDKWIYGWRVVDESVQRGLIIDLHRAGVEVWDADLKRYLLSNKIRRYDPVFQYLQDTVGHWDGHDHIGDLAATVPTAIPEWPQWFRTWLLATVAQWMGRNRRYGNSIVPLLISPQGYRKSTFCKNLLPPELRWGYTDNLLLENKKEVFYAMSSLLLINLDEFNKISPTVQQGFLKNVIQLSQVKTKRPYGSTMEDLPRRASFIATTNMNDILSDPSGCRRFIGVELTAPIKINHSINHFQLYAQVMAALASDERSWFDEAETERVIQHNRQFQVRTPLEQYFYNTFQVATEDDAEAKKYTTTEIFDILRSKAGSQLRLGSLTHFGRFLAHLPNIRRYRRSCGTLYLLKRIDL